MTIRNDEGVFFFQLNFNIGKDLAWIVSVNAKSEFLNYHRNNYVVKATSSYTFVRRFCCLFFSVVGIDVLDHSPPQNIR